MYKPQELREGGRGGGGAGHTEYRFKVCYDHEEEEAYIDLARSENGWGLLGTYYFNRDTVRVVLTDDTKLRTFLFETSFRNFFSLIRSVTPNERCFESCAS